MFGEVLGLEPGPFALRDSRHDLNRPHLSATTAELVYCTFLGASGDDAVQAIAVDATGATYVAGGTTSSDFATTPGAFDRTYNGGTSEGPMGDAFVAKLNAAGTALVYATFLGGADEVAQLCVELSDRHLLSQILIRNRKSVIGGFMPRRAYRWPVVLTEPERAALAKVEDYVLSGYAQAEMVSVERIE